MQNHRKTFKIIKNKKIFEIEATWDDDDILHCHTPQEDIALHEINNGRETTERLFDHLQISGYEIQSCDTCVYFTQGGMMTDSEATFGYCLKGKIGQHVTSKDYTHMTSICDEHQFGEEAEARRIQEEWADSLPPWKGKKK